jgi:hypothetical protein
MPKLSIFTFCEKVIIDDTGVASLIGLFNQIKVTPPTTPLPPNAAAPKEWAVFVSWTVENGDEGKEFDQLVRVLTPGGVVFTEIRTKFVMQKNKNQQVRMPLIGVPIAAVGDCAIWLSLKHQGRIIAEPPPIYLKVEHLPATPRPS